MFGFVLAAVLGCAELCAAEARAHYDDLLAASGYGRLDVERGGFLIRERGGAITFAPWDSPGGFRRASYRGAIPEGTIAIVHTHPLKSPRPSAQDRKEAARTGLPVVVVTPREVVAAMPDGTLSVVVRDSAAR